MSTMSAFTGYFLNRSVEKCTHTLIQKYMPEGGGIESCVCRKKKIVDGQLIDHA